MSIPSWKSLRHRRITGFGGKSSRESNTEVYLTFHLKVRASHLNAQNYSQYQKFLYQEITNLRKKGWTFTKIAEWLNDKGYSTVRGRIFKSSHVHSIVKKKRVSDERLTIRYEPKLSNFGLRFLDRTLISTN